jgi:ABC-2 type transport system ATP-binding protein
MSIISIQHLTKRYGPVLAVDDLSFDVPPGRVTGFLGPNGSGKTSTLRILLGLAAATAGTATIGGRAYHQLPEPARQVGAALDSNTFHPGRSAAQHLRVITTAAGLPRRRVDEVLGLVGLADVAGRRVGGFSLGMRQRLSLAGALLGDPGALIFDEPLNGLDPDGARPDRARLQPPAQRGGPDGRRGGCAGPRPPGDPDHAGRTGHPDLGGPGPDTRRAPAARGAGRGGPAGPPGR